MRQISKQEIDIINFVAEANDISLIVSEDQLVWMVNPQMKSIRSDFCPKGKRVFSCGSLQFEDEDGVPVVVTLLLTENRQFGELDFWKVDDTPLLRLPTTRDEMCPT